MDRPPNTEVPGLELEILRILKTFYDVQKLRVATELRVKQTRFSLCPNKHMVPMASHRDRCPICGEAADAIEVEPPEILRSVLNDLGSVERKLYRELERIVRGHQLYVKYLQYVDGVGPAIGAYLVTILNPARFETASRMWKYCGLHVVNGKAPRRVAGQPTP
jgi:predicted nuclease of restriction endonuclease-like RecB superfamily